ncbi:Hypothetical_protein [Hexamita inflata]|uniref:Hypothetical_protein n=1 Tax=Hexamita inflata TaxID=28002 RepID=A0AA86V5P4_9EUKA|nr:Hypothetical protein HINF_LOCUS64892 [Hexamita inflata]
MEAHSPFNLNPVQFQLSAMPTIQSLRYAYSGPSSEILDVSEILRMIEDLNQNELLEFWNIMSQIHSCETKHIQEYCSTLQQSISQDSFGSDDVQKSRASKHMTEKVLKTKAIIKSALIQVIRSKNEVRLL